MKQKKKPSNVEKAKILINLDKLESENYEEKIVEINRVVRLNDLQGQIVITGKKTAYSIPNSDILDYRGETEAEIERLLKGQKYKEISVEEFDKITDLQKYVNDIETSVKNTSSPDSPNKNSTKNETKTQITFNPHHLKGFKEVDKNSTKNKDVALLKSTLDIGSNKIGSKSSTKFYENGGKVAIMLSENDFGEAILKLQQLENQGKIKLELSREQIERFEDWKQKNPNVAKNVEQAFSSELSKSQEKFI